MRDESEFFKGIQSPRIAKEMIELASHILDSKAGRFDASKFKDQYELALRKLVKRKALERQSRLPRQGKIAAMWSISWKRCGKALEAGKMLR